jgi:hypothetical protein
MVRARTVAGTLDHRGLLPILELASSESWSGQIRVSRPQESAGIWMVNGEIVHAILRGRDSVDGFHSLTMSSRWRQGEYVLHADSLPPDRTIRIPTTQLLSVIRKTISDSENIVEVATATPVVGRVLLEVLNGLKAKVPGLESVSLTRGANVEATTFRNRDEMKWMERRLRAFFAGDDIKADALYVQEGIHSLLILKGDSVSTIVSARPGTPREELFWAGSEIQRQVSDETLLPSR